MGSSHSSIASRSPLAPSAAAHDKAADVTTTTDAATAAAPAPAASPTIPRVFASSASFCVSPSSQPNAFVFFEDSRPGEATPLIAICLPGIGDTRRQFRLLAPLLHDQLGCRVLLGDLRGFGDSTDFADNAGYAHSAYSPEAVAADVVQLMSELHARHPASEFLLLGNSLSAGSMVLAAMATLSQQQQRQQHQQQRQQTQTYSSASVRAVVLLGPILRDSSIDTWFRPLSHLMFRELYGAKLWLSYYKTLFPGARPADFDAELALLSTHVRAKRSNIVNIGRFVRASKRAVEQAVGAFGALQGPPLPAEAGATEATSTTTAPPLVPAVLAVYGRNDPDFVDFDAELAWFQRMISRATCIEFTDGGHYPHLEDPQRVLDAIAALLQ